METSETIVAEEEQEKTQSLTFSIIARDVATLGSGTLLGALFGTLLVFLIPRLISLEDFGYWRLFLLYAGYVGLLHMGFDDGALLRWAGRPLKDFHHEIGSSVGFLFWQQLAILAAGVLVCLIVLRSELLYVAVAVLLFALVYNLSALLQFGLQAAREFTPVAIATAAPTGIFIALALVWRVMRTPDFRSLVGLYVLAWMGVLVFLWRTVKPTVSFSPASAWGVGRAFISIGWPIVLANTGYAVVQTADRLVVSAAMSIYQFAQYSLAASAMFVPITAIAAISRVVFPHLAAIARENHGKTYTHASRLLVMAWSLMLPYYMMLDVFVRHALPKYVPGLPIAKILLLGVVFLAGIQIMHANFFNLYGWQRRFLLHSAGAIILAFSLTIACALLTRSLTAVAIAQVCAGGIWWLIDEWKLRPISGQGWGDSLRIVGVFVWSSLSLLGSLALITNAGLRVVVYYGLVIVVLAFACPPEMRFCWRLVGSVHTRRPSHGTGR